MGPEHPMIMIAALASLVDTSSISSSPLSLPAKLSVWLAFAFDLRLGERAPSSSSSCLKRFRVDQYSFSPPLKNYHIQKSRAIIPKNFKIFSLAFNVFFAEIRAFLDKSKKLGLSYLPGPVYPTVPEPEPQCPGTLKTSGTVCILFCRFQPFKNRQFPVLSESVPAAFGRIRRCPTLSVPVQG